MGLSLSLPPHCLSAAATENATPRLRQPRRVIISRIFSAAAALRHQHSSSFSAVSHFSSHCHAFSSMPEHDTPPPQITTGIDRRREEEEEAGSHATLPAFPVFCPLHGIHSQSGMSACSGGFSSFFSQPGWMPVWEVNYFHAWRVLFKRMLQHTPLSRQNRECQPASQLQGHSEPSPLQPSRRLSLPRRLPHQQPC